MNNPVSVEFLDKFAAAWNEHDVNAIVSMMTPDAVMFMSVGPNVDGRRINGRDELRSAISSLFEMLPDAQWRDAKHFIAGDRGVTQWTFTATRADGSKIESTGCDVFSFRDGRIAVKDSYRKQPTW